MQSQRNTYNSKTAGAALLHFKNVDPLLAQLTEKHLAVLKLPTAAQPSTYFSYLCSSIISQQLSVKAADTIEARVRAITALTPEDVVEVEPAALRAAGLSYQKISYLHNLAHEWTTLTRESFSDLPNEELIAKLITVKGIGRWTAEMFLLFGMARADIFSYGDLILRTELCKLYGLDARRDKAAALAQAEVWAPYRSVASLVLWKQYRSGL